ncbi:MAG: hypothetical protein HY961_03940 [Ignavibacteriae bacterium]|nr:hypothetical protein [Ignavibacteriota bacterium]
MHTQGTSKTIELALSLDPTGYPSGKDNIVWGTFDARQAETIAGSLKAQQIVCQVQKKKISTNTLYLLAVGEEREASEAMDFIWREGSGLRLKPDWSYADGEMNTSFELWINGR